MIRALAIVMILVGTAHANPLTIIKPPAGWTGGPDMDLVKETGALPHFGNVHGIIEASRYEPGKPGVVLYGTRITANVSPPGAAARFEIDTMKPAMAHVIDAREEAGPDQQVTAFVAWEDKSAGTHGISRMVVVATKDKIEATRGDCIRADDADDALAKACTDALASLGSELDIKDRIAIELPKAGAPPPSSGPQLSTMDDAEHATHPPIVVAQQTSAGFDKRPLVVGAGLVLLAGAFWWNRKRRARIEVESKEAP